VIANFLLLFFLSLGLGGFLPSLNTTFRLDLGIRLLSGYALMTCLLYLGIVLLGLGVSTSLYTLIVIGLTGSLVLIRKALCQLTPSEYLLHPTFVLPVLIICVALFHGPIHFTPYGDDTFINWLIHAKQVWLVDTYYDDRIYSSSKGYMPGWHFLLGFTSPLWGSFSDTRAIAAPVVLHVALIAAAYDSISIWIKTQVIDKWQVWLFSTLVILLLLTAEASWQLVPTLILSEMPLFYTLIGIFIIGSYYYTNDARIYPISIVLSLILCAHYLLKTQGLAAIPITSMIGFTGYLYRTSFDRKNLLKALSISILILIPTLIVVVSWKVMGPQSSKCIADAGEFLNNGLSQLIKSLQWNVLLGDLVGGIWVYVSTYKVALTLFSILGVCIALFDCKLRWLSLALVTYIIIYSFSVYWVYLSCPNGFNSYLSSLQRYIQLPIRLLHFIGPMMLATIVLKSFLKNFKGIDRKTTNVTVYILISTLVVYQLMGIKKSYETMQSPNKPKMEFYANTILNETENLLKVAADREIKYPDVLLIHGFWESLPYLIAAHYGLKNSQINIHDNETLARWRLKSLQLNKDGVETHQGPNSFEIPDIVWPIESSPLISNKIRVLTNNPVCIKHPAQYFLVRSSHDSNTFDCVLKISNK
jgi:hypothetical protein